MEYAGTLEIPAVIIFRNVIALQRLAGTIKKTETSWNSSNSCRNNFLKRKSTSKTHWNNKKSLNHPGTLKNLP